MRRSVCSLLSKVCRCVSSSPGSAKSASYLVRILLSAVLTAHIVLGSHSSAERQAAYSGSGHPLGFLANSMALQTAGIQDSHPLSYFPQALNGLLGTVEVIQKKKKKARNESPEFQYTSTVWISCPLKQNALPLSREALLKQTRC